MKKVLLTFDYEPFLYKTGNIEKTLILPTSTLLKELSKNEMVATFFIDTLFLDRILKDAGSESKLWSRVSGQILDIYNAKHEIALHLHPHWLDAEYNGMSEWDLSNVDKYRLHVLAANDIDNLVKRSIDIIRSIVGKDAWKEKISYRAGGWSIQPFSHLRSIFAKYNIAIDSSVSAGISNTRSPFYYDFQSVENNMPYRFSSDVCLEDIKGEFLEVPITSYTYNFAMRLVSKIGKVLQPKKYSTFGRGVAILDSDKKSIFKHLQSNITMLSIDRTSPSVFWYIVRTVKEKTVVIISHPKDYSPSSALCLKVVRQMKGVDFIAMSCVDKK